MRNLNFYKEWANNIKEAIDIKPKGYEKQVKYDIEFLQQFASSKTELIDIGAGTGATINNLVNNFKNIIAIELFNDFSKFINKNIKVIEGDIKEIDLSKIISKNNQTIISAFGVFNHMEDNDTIKIYKHIFNSIKKNDLFIMKHAMGKYEDIFFENTNYWAIYRHVDKELEFLKKVGFEQIECHNIYNDLYKQNNTNYYVIVAKK